MFGQKAKKMLLSLTTISLMGLSFGLTASSSKAAGVAVTLAAGDQNAAVSTATAPTLTFTTATTYAVGNTVTLYYPSTYTDTSLVSANATITATGLTTATNVVNTTANTVVFTITAGSIASGVVVTVEITTNLTTSATLGNYTYSIVTSRGEYGAALQYVGDANDVTVTAEVLPILTFAIRNLADTADTNVCALGTLTIAAVNTCAYRLKVATNATSGYTVTVDTDGDLRLSGSGNVLDPLEIDPIGVNGTVTAGTEGYGIVLAQGATTSGATVTRQGNFANANNNPLPITTPSAFYIAAGVNAPAGTDTTNTALVTHRAAIDGGTSGGVYTQLVTYTVAATF